MAKKDGFLLGKDKDGFFKQTEEIDELPPLTCITPALLSRFRIKNKTALPFLTFSTECYLAPEIKLVHFPKCESADKLYFNDYSVTWSADDYSPHSSSRSNTTSSAVT